MGALKIPARMVQSRGTQALCNRIGVRFNGVDQGTSVVAYDAPAGWIQLKNGARKNGDVEPYWR